MAGSWRGNLGMRHTSRHVPGIPGACATRNFTHLARGLWCDDMGSEFRIISQRRKLPLAMYHCQTYTCSKTPSLQWNNCLCTFWPYSQSSLTLFARIPNYDRLLFECLAARQLVKRKINYWAIPKITGNFCPNWPRTKYCLRICSQDEVRQPYLYFKSSDGVFLLPIGDCSPLCGTSP